MAGLCLHPHERQRADMKTAPEGDARSRFHLSSLNGEDEDLMLAISGDRDRRRGNRHRRENHHDNRHASHRRNRRHRSWDHNRRDRNRIRGHNRSDRDRTSGYKDRSCSCRQARRLITRTDANTDRHARLGACGCGQGGAGDNQRTKSDFRELVHWGLLTHCLDFEVVFALGA